MKKNEIQHFWNETAPSWTRSKLLNDRAIQLMKAKVYVDMDSVLCLERIFTTVDAIEQWRGQVVTFQVELFGNISED